MNNQSLIFYLFSPPIFSLRSCWMISYLFSNKSNIRIFYHNRSSLLLSSPFPVLSSSSIHKNLFFFHSQKTPCDSFFLSQTMLKFDTKPSFLAGEVVYSLSLICSRGYFGKGQNTENYPHDYVLLMNFQFFSRIFPVENALNVAPLRELVLKKPGGHMYENTHWTKL